MAHRLTTLDGQTVLGTSQGQNLTLAAQATAEDTATFNATGITLWSLENPQRYMVTTTVSDDEGRVIDTVTTKTGFRIIDFDANTGFMLNGEKMKLKGVSMHHDQGALGARAYRAAIARQIDILKEMGTNAIRVTHNPASRDLIDLADEKGMLIVEEIFDGFQYPKNGNYNDYSRFFERQCQKTRH